ncbi:MAG: hypothetical protein RIR48_3255 [Bacteroidota bacterium]|jgi:hypothetical protein
MQKYYRYKFSMVTYVTFFFLPLILLREGLVILR